MWFFNSFVKSLYDLNWLRARRGEPGKAFSYFFLFIFFVSGLYFAPLAVNMMRGDGIAQAKAVLNKKVPDFTATIANGELSVTGLKQPFIHAELDGQDRFLIVIDTVSTGTLRLEDYLQDVTKAVSGVLITKDKIEIYELERGQFRSQSFKNFGDFSFNRGNLIDIANKFLSKPALFLYSLAVFFFMYAGTVVRKLVLVLVASLLVFWAAKIAKKDWKYKNILSVSLFALTLPSVFLMVFGALPFKSGWATVMLLPLVLTACWLGAVVFTGKGETPVSATEIKPQQ